MKGYNFKLTDVDFLEGREVSQVVIDPSGLSFRFDDGLIYVEGACVLERPTEPRSIRYQFRTTQSSAALTDFHLHELLGRRVEKVLVDGPSFRLEFNDGYCLTVLSIDGTWESGQVAWERGGVVF